MVLSMSINSLNIYPSWQLQVIVLLLSWSTICYEYYNLAIMSAITSFITDTATNICRMSSIE